MMKNLKLIACLLVFLAVLMAIYTRPLLPNLLALQLSFTETDFNSTLHHWPPENITRFKLHFLLDFPYLICYGALGFLITTRTKFFNYFSHSTKTVIALLLPLAAVADAMENVMQLYFLYGEKPFSASNYLLAGIISSTKWLLIISFVLISLPYRKMIPSSWKSC